MMSYEQMVARMEGLETEVRRLTRLVENIREGLNQHTHTVAIGEYDGHGNCYDQRTTEAADVTIDDEPPEAAVAPLPPPPPPDPMGVTSIRVVRFEGATVETMGAFGNVHDPLASITFIHTAKELLTSCQGQDPQGVYQMQTRVAGGVWRPLDVVVHQTRVRIPD